MPFLGKPTSESIQQFLADQSALDPTYSPAGATTTTPPAGYALDRTRVKLGASEQVFTTGKSVLEHWGQFRIGWVETLPENAPIKEGQVVAILARSVGLWWLNACRIVRVIDEDGPVKRFGFAYGTLPGHAESGEERFLVEWDRRDDSVWYDILAFSRPRHFLAKLGYPWVRHVQRRFRLDSAAAMCRATGSGASARP
jgi:uncharacterized protein (UPF0548 family)